MLDIIEAKTAAKAIFLQAAILSGFEVSNESPEKVSDLVAEGFEKVMYEQHRRPEAVANILRVIAATLELAQLHRDTKLFETSVQRGRTKVCPVYPFE